MHKRRQIFLIFLVVIHSFSDVIHTARFATGKRHEIDGTKSSEDVHYPSLENLATLKHSHDNGIIQTKPDKNDSVDNNFSAPANAADDRNAVVDDGSTIEITQITPMIRRDLEGKRLLKRFALKPINGNDEESTGENFLSQASDSRSNQEFPVGSKSIISNLGRLLNSPRYSVEPKKFNSQFLKNPDAEKVTIQVGRQVDPIHACVEAYCSKSDWELEEYLSCISHHCLTTVAISGKRDLEGKNIYSVFSSRQKLRPSKSSFSTELKGGDSNETSYQKTASQKSILEELRNILRNDKENSEAKGRPLTLLIPQHLHFDDFSRGKRYDDEETNDQEVIDDVVKDKEHREKDDLPEIRLKIKRWLKHMLGPEKVWTQQDNNNNRRRRSHELLSEKSTHIVDTNAQTNFKQRNSFDSNSNQHTKQEKLQPHDTPIAELSARLSKRGFNDVYNTCVQSNCGHDGSRGLVYYSCIQHHCG